jgi:Legionella pneumophila major outer membrane protein precursor
MNLLRKSLLAIYGFLFCMFFSKILLAAEMQKYSSNCYGGLPNIDWQCRSRPYVLFADFLYWTAKESGSDNWAINFSEFSTYQKIDVQSVPFKWDPGFRLGIDYVLSHDDWDVKGFYSRFYTKANDFENSISGLSSPFLGNFYINNADGSSVQSAPKYSSASVNWAISFNMLDLEIGKKYYVSSCLILRPFADIKGGWIHQKIHTRWFSPINVTSQTTFTSGKENLKNNFWGVGPGIGINSDWQLAHFKKNAFNIFGDFSAAILGGRWSFQDVYKNDQPQKVSIGTSNLTGASTMFRYFFGLKYISNSKNDKISFFTKVGYEAQIWLNQLQFYSYNTGRLSNPLTLQGATIDFSINF